MHYAFKIYTKIKRHTQFHFGNFLNGVFKLKLLYRIKFSPMSNVDSNKLRQNGFITLKSFVSSEFIVDQFQKFTNSENVELNFMPIFADKNKGQFYGIELSSPFLFNQIFTDELYQILHGYFGGEFYLRNNIQFSIMDGTDRYGTETFHIDGDNCVNMMINLNDVDENTTHMEFLKGADKALKVEDIVPENFMSYKTLGKAGSAFLFANGRFYHRRIVGRRREAILLSFIPSVARKFFGTDRGSEQNGDNFYLSRLRDEMRETLHGANPGTWKLSNFKLIYRNEKI